MSDIIELNLKILGGKPIIKVTRITVALLYELILLGYNIEEIRKEFPHLNREVILKVVELGNDALKNISQIK